MFDLKSPCATCPFRKGKGSHFRLHRDRLTEISKAPSFQCHKTVDYSGEQWAAGDHPQQCAGLMAVLHRMHMPNQMMQVATRLGVLNPATLDPRREAYDSWLRVLEAHAGRREGLTAAEYRQFARYWERRMDMTWGQRKRNVRIMLALASGERRRAVAEREGITRPRITQIVQEANKQGVMRRRKWVPLPVENGENVA